MRIYPLASGRRRTDQLCKAVAGKKRQGVRRSNCSKQAKDRPIRFVARNDYDGGIISFFTTDKILLPLKPLLTVLVISNIVTEVFTYVFGVFTGLAGVVRARAKGIDNITSKEADSIMRQLKKGTVGLTVLMLGYFGVNSIYGYVLFACYVGLVLRSVIGTAKES